MLDQKSHLILKALQKHGGHAFYIDIRDDVALNFDGELDFDNYLDKLIEDDFLTMDDETMVHSNGPYIVMAEEYWDYYKDPPDRVKLFESYNYFEAIAFAEKYYNNCSKEELEKPGVTSLWITPEPKGHHFDYQQYIKTLNQSS